MKKAFALCGLVFVGMYVVAQATLQRPPKDNIVRLRWATDANPARAGQIALFQKMYPGIEVSVDPNAGDASKIIVQCATGTGPDIMDTSQDSMNSLVEAGVLLDLTPYAKTMGFDTSKTYPSMKGGLEVDGKQYRFPCNVVADALVYNKEIFDDRGVPYPKSGWTYAEFVHTLKLLKNNPSKSGHKALSIANTGGAGMYTQMLTSMGGSLFSKDGLYAQFDSPQSLKALQNYYDMMYVDKVIPTPSDVSSLSAQGGWGSGNLNIFSQGNAAILPIGRWYIVQVPNFPDLKGKLGAVTFPRMGDGPSSTVAGARGAGINVKSPHWREALKFLQFLASEEYSKNIVEEGDSLPPNPNLAKTGEALVNEMVKEPEFHQAFVDAIDTAQPLGFSPYISSSQTLRWLGEYVEKVENRLLTPKDAMKMLTAQVNRQIRINLERRPDLQKKFEQETGRPYSVDWS